MTIDDAVLLAEVLDVDPVVWFMEPAEVIEHVVKQWGADRVISKNRTFLSTTLRDERVLVGAYHAA